MLVVGTAIITQIGHFDALWVAMLGSAITGLGMGLSATTILVAIQGAVRWERRGVATGLVQFSRTIGGAVGVGLMGGILTAFVGAASSAILDPTRGSSQLGAARADLAAGLGWIYWILLAASVVSLVVAIRRMPDERLAGTGRATTAEAGPAPGPAGRAAGGPELARRREP
jgi:MFS family permease